MSFQNHPFAPLYSALGFHSLPFSITPDTSLAYPSEQYVSALSRLHHAATGGSLAVLSAEIGLGKTLLLRCLLRTLPPDVKVAYLFNPLLDQAALLREVHAEFSDGDGAVKTDLASLHHSLTREVLKGASRGLRYVIIVDEAHRLNTEALEALRVLSNLETEKQKLINLILVGQPELVKTLALRSMRPLRERIGVWIQLRPMNKAEGAAYIRHRIARTHADGDLRFDWGALWLLHWRTQGVPRRINLACERAILMAAVSRKRRISWLMVWTACNDFRKAWA